MIFNGPNCRRSDKLMSNSCHKKNNGCKRNSATKTKNRNRNKNKNETLSTKNNKQIYHTTHKSHNVNDSSTTGEPGVTPGGGDGGTTFTKGGIGNGDQQVISCKLLTKKVLIFIGFSVIVIAVGAFVARIFLTQKSLNWLKDVLSPITNNIYQFLSLFVVGLVICILYAQGRIYLILQFLVILNKRRQINKHEQCVINGSSVLAATGENDRKSQIRFNSGNTPWSTPHITDDYDNDNININMYDDNEYNNDYNGNMSGDGAVGGGVDCTYHNEYQFSAMPLATAQPLAQKEVIPKTDGTNGLYNNNPNEMRNETRKMKMTRMRNMICHNMDSVDPITICKGVKYNCFLGCFVIVTDESLLIILVSITFDTFKFAFCQFVIISHVELLVNVICLLIGIDYISWIDAFILLLKKQETASEHKEAAVLTKEKENCVIMAPSTVGLT